MLGRNLVADFAHQRRPDRTEEAVGIINGVSQMRGRQICDCHADHVLVHTVEHIFRDAVLRHQLTHQPETFS
jgi:hypothetical protein